MPYINVRKDEIVRQIAPSTEGTWLLHAFVGAAHAVRRDVFLSIGGYREHFFYMGEEGDFCLRMLQAGYITIAGRADAVHHLESPRRSMARADYYGRRNDILFVWHNAPLPAMMVHLPGTAVNGLIWSCQAGRYCDMIQGMAAGFVGCVSRWRDRDPVGPGAYALYRRLKRERFVRLVDVEHALSAITSRSQLVSKVSRSLV